ncbi:hypothetical protein F5B19DRAFT_16470 [Rostrohypoxylon terebratum]|nr:hypothetical protein F5B19DRAFT_16470 [Rostrohypoxylon terebratum]
MARSRCIWGRLSVLVIGDTSAPASRSSPPHLIFPFADAFGTLFVVAPNKILPSKPCKINDPVTPQEAAGTGSRHFRFSHSPNSHIA